jgi:hypothetical protein
LLGLDGEEHSYSHYLVIFLYNARIWNEMTRNGWDLGYSKLLLVEDL